MEAIPIYRQQLPYYNTYIVQIVTSASYYRYRRGQFRCARQSIALPHKCDIPAWRDQEL